MPAKTLQLQFAIPCTKPLIAEGGETSLIGVLEQITSELPKEAPEKLLVPFQWTLVTLWTRGDEDFTNPVDFEQKCVVTDPQGDALPDILHTFSVNNDHRNFRNSIEFPAFPVTTTGMVTVEVFLREKGTDEWNRFSIYRIMTERKVKENNDENNA